ncbi:hypothetical protein H8356DRAFT_1335085 [Neocallimastix lanati (nom. inval.)]|nr:hypothetical protein H8356DRAFT_1335085 [Neocallimastix sp. JGI-2020a]
MDKRQQPMENTLLEKMAMLRGIKLDDNNLSGSISPQLGNLFDNNLNGSILPELKNFYKLQYFNNLNGSIPPKLRTLLSNLIPIIIKNHEVDLLKFISTP